MKAEAEMQAAREARIVPSGDPKALVEFLLNTKADEMQFEIARCRPELARRHCELSRAIGLSASPQTAAFFDHLKEAVREEKFSSRSRADRVAELEGLQKLVEVRLRLHGRHNGSHDRLTG
jgi:hypothetical protein